MLYTLTQIGFAATTIVFFYLLLKTFFDALPKTNLSELTRKKFKTSLLTVVIGWAVFVSVLSLSGVFGNFELFPLNVAPALLIPLVSIIFFTFTKTFKEVLLQLHPAQLIKLQVFRVVVEVLLWMLFIQNLAPIQMTFEGRNLDILSGLTAPVMSYLAYNNKV